MAIVTDNKLHKDQEDDQDEKEQKFYFLRMLIEANSQQSRDYISKIQIALFNKKGQILSPFSHLNIDGT